MNIVIGSAFRNATNHVDRWFDQVAALRSHAGPGHYIRAIAAEGDSTDGTLLHLMSSAARHEIEVNILKCDHGLPWFGSVETAERMKALSFVSNTIFDGVQQRDDVLVYVESDLLWTPHVVGTLIDMAMVKADGFDVFAPMIFAGSAFYDIWGFRKNGERFVPFPPYHIGLNGAALCEIDSAGSCLIMRAEVARRCRIRNDNALVGWCEDARHNGFKVAVAPGLRIDHP